MRNCYWAAERYASIRQIIHWADKWQKSDVKETFHSGNQRIFFNTRISLLSYTFIALTAQFATCLNFSTQLKCNWNLVKTFHSTILFKINLIVCGFNLTYFLTKFWFESKEIHILNGLAKTIQAIVTNDI